MQKKRVLVRAYCQSNLGDDLFVLQLARRYPQHQFVLYAVGANGDAFRNEKNIVLPGFLSRVRRKLMYTLGNPGGDVFSGAGADAYVTIGGSIFWENAPISFGTEKAPCFLIGPNCEDSYSDAYYQALHDALAQVDQCCFRDRYSYSLFRDLPNVSYAPDVLFDWNPPQKRKRGEGIAVSVISPSDKKLSAQQEAYYSAVAGLCDLCSERKIPVTLLGFCRSEGDAGAIAEILARTQAPSWPGQYVYAGDPEEMLERLNDCETVVAARFHGMILGWVLEKNVVPVIYGAKQFHVLDDIGFSGPAWDLRNGKEMTASGLLAAALADAGRLDISQWKEKSVEQFRGLDAFLTEKGNEQTL